MLGVNAINHAFGDDLPLGEWVCECANESCSERIELSSAEYETVRGDGKRFAIAPTEDHCFPEKRGRAGELAAMVDPRRVGLRGAPGRSD